MREQSRAQRRSRNSLQSTRTRRSAVDRILCCSRDLVADAGTMGAEPNARTVHPAELPDAARAEEQIALGAAERGLDAGMARAGVTQGPGIRESGLLRARKDCRDSKRVFQNQFDFPNLEHLAKEQAGLMNGLAINKRPIGRSQIPDQQRTAQERDLAMRCRHGRMIDLEIVAQASANPVRAGTELKRQSLRSLGSDKQSRHPKFRVTSVRQLNKAADAFRDNSLGESTIPPDSGTKRLNRPLTRGGRARMPSYPGALPARGSGLLASGIETKGNTTNGYRNDKRL